MIAKYVERLLALQHNTAGSIPPVQAPLASPLDGNRISVEPRRSARSKRPSRPSAPAMVVVVRFARPRERGRPLHGGRARHAEAINFMATHGRGLICLTLTPERCDELGLRLMVAHNQSPYETAFTVSIEAREGIETGISASDRARTIQVACATADGPARHRPARACLPAARAPGRRAGARRPDRGLRRPRAARRPPPGRRDLRGHEGRRHDGPRARPRRRSAPSTG